mmetsp:Transcript_1061/g.3628  ORF Transcript_1061/g.3628 Transcript_1061/m.3628 type:complete len:147 (-) Transcript_1061:132-572(-)
MTNDAANTYCSPLLPAKSIKYTTKACKQLISSTQSAKDKKKASRLLFGVRAITKAIARKDQQGLVLLAKGVEPIDCIIHLPALCEEKKIPYAFVPSTEDLQTAAQRKSNLIALLMPKPSATDDEEYAKLYKKVAKAIKKLDHETYF